MTKVPITSFEVRKIYWLNNGICWFIALWLRLLSMYWFKRFLTGKTRTTVANWARWFYFQRRQVYMCPAYIISYVHGGIKTVMWNDAYLDTKECLGLGQMTSQKQYYIIKN